MENENKDCYECAKKCENCQFLKQHYQREKESIDNKKREGGINWICVLLIGFLIYIFSTYFTSRDFNAIVQSFKPRPTVNINGHRVKIKDGSYADYLIESGLCTSDDIQRMVDELLHQ